MEKARFYEELTISLKNKKTAVIIISILSIVLPIAVSLILVNNRNLSTGLFVMILMPVVAVWLILPFVWMSFSDLRDCKTLINEIMKKVPLGEEKQFEIGYLDPESLFELFILQQMSNRKSYIGIYQNTCIPEILVVVIKSEGLEEVKQGISCKNKKELEKLNNFIKIIE